MLYKEMTFDYQDQITEKLKAHFIVPKYMNTDVPVYSARLTYEEVDSVVPELTAQFRAMGLEYDMFRTFVTKAKGVSAIHRDGTEGDWKLIALNWPLYNCDRSHMMWYDLKPGAQNTNLPNLPYNVTTFSNQDAVLIDKLVLKKPTFLRVDVPHNVANYTAENRLIISFRFKPEPTWLFE
jgi:hypothetical protein